MKPYWYIYAMQSLKGNGLFHFLKYQLRQTIKDIRRERAKKRYNEIIIKDGIEQNYSPEFYFPKTVKTICPYAFCSVEYLRIPLDMIEVGAKIENCSRMAFWDTDKVLLKNPVYKKENGLMINTKLKTVLYADKSVSKVIIPDGIKKIGAYAFAGLNVESVTIPESVKEIGFQAFAGCDNLINLAIPSSVKKIGEYCFSQCRNLNELLLSKKLEKQSENIFSTFDEERKSLIIYY
ncbi:MAG: leucine-rich repeat domain-containing protein [Treponema sp.]|nr:leucine-rich repeat domain-containing protein [Treponema sp.]